MTGVQTCALPIFWVNLAGLRGGVATIHVFVNPLVSWIWFGGLLLLAGSVVAAWPQRRRMRATAPAVDEQRAPA